MNTLLTNILPAAAVIGGLGLVLGVGLSFADKFFTVEDGADIKNILDKLPGIDCGACGYSGCGQFAAAIKKEQAFYDGCPIYKRKNVKP